MALKDWFEWGDLGSAIKGAGTGFIASGFNPLGALAGAGVGYVSGNIAQELSPSPKQPVIQPGRSPIGSDVQQAFDQELSAAQSSINQSLGTALQQADIQYGTRGLYRSGERLDYRNKLGQAAARDEANARNQLALERLSLEQQVQQFGLTHELQVAQLEAQKSASTTAMYAGIAEAAAPLLMEWLLPQVTGLFGGQDVTGSSGVTSAWDEIRV